MDVPYDITGVRFLNWTWHDTDPNIFDRSYFVPWNSYMFHFTFACSMSIIMYRARTIFDKKASNIDMWSRGSCGSEIFAVIMTSVFSMPLGSLMFVATYHPLHDFLNVPTEAVVIPIFAILFLIVWTGDRKNVARIEEETKSSKKSLFVDKLLSIYLLIHYTTFVVIHTVFNPEDHLSISLHETIGDCASKVPVRTILKDLEKNEFLCAKNYDEKYFDFSCLKEVPPSGSSWYPVCGTPYE